MTPRSAIAVVALGIAGLGAASPADAATGRLGCAAGAVSGTVLGQAVAPLASAGDLSSACRTQDASGALAPALGTASALARTRLEGNTSDPAAQRATSVAGLSDLKIGALDSLLGALPVPALPAGLDALNVPLPVVLPTGTATSTGTTTLPTVGGLPGLPTIPSLPVVGDPVSTVTSLLPSAIKIDALDAVRALLPAAPALPDLLSLSAARSTATAACAGGVPVLDGATDLVGLKVLGQDLGTGGLLERALTVAPGSSIPLAGADLSKIALPAGLSFADPVVGPVLANAVRSALAALPPIDIPALVANVKLTPAAQERSADGTTLTQRAARLQVSLLGRDLVDLALGEARVAATGVDCAPAAPVAPASQLAIECAKRPVTLVDVAQRKEHVSLLGAVAKQHVGRSVSIVFAATGEKVATAVVRPDGFFRAKAPLPPAAMRSSNDARYLAVLDGHKSLALKLQRRMRISKLSNRGERILMIGKITGPLVPGQEIVIRRRESCTKDVIVKRFTPTRAGTWKAWLPAPTEGQAAVYRATTQVFGADETEKRFPTFTLPGYVSL